jgi:hypothetical protein
MSEFKDNKNGSSFLSVTFWKLPGFVHLSSFWKEQYVVENEYGEWHDTDRRKPKTVLGEKSVPMPL